MTAQPFKFYFGQATEKFGRFSHEAHVHATWHILQDAPALNALAEFRRGIMNIAAASGKPEKYHETLTVAWFLLVLERLKKGETWDEFITRCPELLNAGLAQEFYTFDLTQNEQARREFITPE